MMRYEDEASEVKVDIENHHLCMLASAIFIRSDSHLGHRCFSSFNRLSAPYTCTTQPNTGC